MSSSPPRRHQKDEPPRSQDGYSFYPMHQQSPRQQNQRQDTSSGIALQPIRPNAATPVFQTTTVSRSPKKRFIDHDEEFPRPNAAAEASLDDAEMARMRQMQQDEELAREQYYLEMQKIVNGQADINVNARPGETKKERKQRLREQKIQQRLADPNIATQLAQRKVYEPWFLRILTSIQILIVFIECGLNVKYTGEFIQTTPSFNYLLGPSAYSLIRMGARVVACMKPTDVFDKELACPEYFRQPGKTTCTFADLCPIESGTPDQWWRFITPIFLHGGLIHAVFNLIFQIQPGFDMERAYGPWRIAVIYFASGIFGFAFGANFSLPYSSSVGASGAIFGLVALLFLDLYHNWKLIIAPKRELAKLMLVVILNFAIGIVPIVDNFSHIGGFFMGLLTSAAVLPSLNFGLRDQRRKQIIRVVASALAIIFFILPFISFYKNTGEQWCSWCRHLSCVPIGDMCEIFRAQQ